MGPPHPPRVAVLGIGQELCGDDAAGVIAARALLPEVAGYTDFLVLDTGPAPENFSGSLRRFKPDLVIMVDAAQMEMDPGAVRVLDWQELDGISFSTHTLPLSIFAHYLVDEFDCTVALIGIQPASNVPGEKLSAPVKNAVVGLVHAFSTLLKPVKGSPW